MCEYLDRVQACCLWYVGKSALFPANEFERKNTIRPPETARPVLKECVEKGTHQPRARVAEPAATSIQKV